MTLLLLFAVVLGVIFLDWKASKGLALLTESVRLLRQLRDAAHQSEQDALDRQAEAIKRGVVEGGNMPLPLR